MARTTMRAVRVSDDLVREAAATASLATARTLDFSILARAGLELIAARLVSPARLCEAIDRAELRSGRPANTREADPT